MRRISFFLLIALTCIGLIYAGIKVENETWLHGTGILIFILPALTILSTTLSLGFVGSKLKVSKAVFYLMYFIVPILVCTLGSIIIAAMFGYASVFNPISKIEVLLGFIGVGLVCDLIAIVYSATIANPKTQGK